MPSKTANRVGKSLSQELTVTISVGVADMAAEMTEPLQFIKVADTNLFKAKRAGRNRVAG